MITRQLGHAPSVFRINVAFAMALAILALIGRLSYHTTVTESKMRIAQQRSAAVIDTVDDVLSLLKDVERGQRGFLLSRKREYLKPYLTAKDLIEGKIQQLEMNSDQPEQKKRNAELRILSKLKLEELGKTIELAQTQKFESAIALLRTDRGNKVMEQIIALSEEMKRDESRHLDRIMSQADEILRHEQHMNFAAGCVLILLLLAALIVMNRHLVIRRNREETLHRSEKFLDLIVESMPTSILMKDTSTLKYVKVNAAAEKLLARSAAEMVGKSAFDIFPENLADETERQDMKTIEEKRLLVFEHVIRAKNGEMKDVLTHKSVLNAPDGSVYLLVISEDITERKRAREAILAMNSELEERIQKRTLELQRRETQLKIITDSLPALISYLDSDLKYLFVNNAYFKWFNMTEREVLGKTMQEVLGDEAAGQLKPLVEKALRGEAVEFETQVVYSKGVTKEIRANYIPDRGPDGQIRGVIALVHDITEKKKTAEERNTLLANERAANEASRLKSEFLANMSHEIRTPLNGVIGMADLLIDTPLSPEQQKFAKVIYESANGLMVILNDILDFSKIEAGRLEMEDTEIDLPKILENQMRLLHATADEKHLALKLELDPSIPSVLRGDPNRIGQVLLNLLGNAIKFTQEGVVTLRASQIRQTENHSSIRFEVVDTGIGMSPAVQKRLFTPFTQADGSTARRFGGTGLGLSISRRLVELMGGSIGVKSTEEQGSTFWFQLDLARKSAAKRRLSASSSGAATVLPTVSAPRSDRKILVAEDNAVNQLLVLTQLKKLGYNAVAVSNGIEAIAALNETSFDLVLMDCQMPEMDGFQATSAIRKKSQEAGSKRIPIVALTANAMKDDEKRCLEAGMDAYLSKPVKLETLAATLENWLSPSTT